MGDTWTHPLVLREGECLAVGALGLLALGRLACCVRVAEGAERVGFVPRFLSFPGELEGPLRRRARIPGTAPLEMDLAVLAYRPRMRRRAGIDAISR